jgi:hypothetical protein
MHVIELLKKRLEEEGLKPDDRECPVVNAICPFRKNYKCKYTRLERAILMLDCAFE